MSTQLFCCCRNAVVLGLLYVCAVSPAFAASIQHLLERDTPPPGVVFEIVEGNRDALSWALPKVQQHVQELRKRFPGLAVAVVSHGFEQFALQIKNANSAGKAHQAVKDLMNQDAVPVHVCGGHAAMYDIAPNEFPDYVDVAPSGPAQIRAYRSLGYELVIVAE